MASRTRVRAKLNLLASGEAAKRQSNVLDAFRVRKGTSVDVFRSKKRKSISVEPSYALPCTPYVASIDEDSCGLVFKETQSSLHLSCFPDALCCRDEEQERILSFCQQKFMHASSGRLYVSGCPGTGKTLAMDSTFTKLALWEQNEKRKPVQKIYMNAMRLNDSNAVFTVLYEKLTNETRDPDVAASRLDALFAAKRLPTLLVLDEIDHLLAREQHILLRVFGWTASPESRLVIVGVSNAIDLLDRFLPTLATHNLGCDVVSFRPYTSAQLVQLLKTRLAHAAARVAAQRAPVISSPASPCDPQPAPLSQSPSAASPIAASRFHPPLHSAAAAPAPHPSFRSLFDDSALELVARKVANSTGDARKALDICWQAAVNAETQHVAEASHKCHCGPDGIARLNGSILCHHVSKVMARCFGSPWSGLVSALPQHHQLLLVVALLYTRRTPNQLTIQNLIDAYVEQSAALRLRPLSGAEVSEVCDALAAHGIFSIRNTSQRTQCRTVRVVALNVQEDDVFHALREVRLFSSLLQPCVGRSVDSARPPSIVHSELPFTRDETPLHHDAAFKKA